MPPADPRLPAERALEASSCGASLQDDPGDPGLPVLTSSLSPHPHWAGPTCVTNSLVWKRWSVTFELEDMATSALLPGIPERSGPPCCKGAQAPRAEAPTAGPAHSQQRAEPSWERVLQPRSGLQASAAQADVPPQPQERPWARNAQLRAPQFPTHRYLLF